MTGVKSLPFDLAKPVVEYLCELREKLAVANDQSAYLVELLLLAGSATQWQLPFVVF
jgi:hypothetical protein